MSQSEKSPICLFPYEKFRFSLQVTTLMVLPPYKGAVFRGAFGNAFRRVVCAVPKGDCATCIVRCQCLYVAFFEPPPPPRYPDAAKFNQAPPPYVLNPPLTNRQAFHPQDVLDFELVLVGRAIDALPYFVYTFMEMGRRGLGAERGKYDLLRVDIFRNGEAIQLYDGRTQTLRTYAPEDGIVSHPEDNGVKALTLHFLTPLRLKEKGKLVTRLSFPLFFERLAQRLAILTAFYGFGAEIPDFTPLTEQAQSVRTIEDELYWYEWKRYSRRQDAEMKFGGLRGKIHFEGELGPLMPYLRLGEQVNVGQSTTFGLGNYETILSSSEPHGSNRHDAE